MFAIDLKTPTFLIESIYYLWVYTIDETARESVAHFKLPVSTYQILLHDDRETTFLDMKWRQNES